MKDRTYIAIDLKSFYASVECIQRGLDPMKTNLVVADASRTEKTICLAVSPSLKAWGIPGRPRLFQVVQKVREINRLRRAQAPEGKLQGSSFLDPEIQSRPELALDYITAPPQMARYMEISGQIYQVYLKYIAPEDIHVYSIDEVFIDATSYLAAQHITAHDLAMKMILDVLKTTGITAAAGIGPNLYLCKIAMDIEAKHIPADENGVRIAQLDELSYRRRLWSHRPLTDFWRVGKGYARKLEEYGIFTMGDIARCSLGKPGEYYSEDLLYRLFGVNAELLIDHAWGWEPCTIRDIKAYQPASTSVGSGQVLPCAYSFSKARLVAGEMADLLALELADKGLVSDQIVLTVGYDIDNLKDPGRRRNYNGEITCDRYGRSVPKHAHGTANLKRHTCSGRQLTQAALDLFDRIVDPSLLIRRLSMSAGHVVSQSSLNREPEYEQISLFDLDPERQLEKEKGKAQLEKEKKLQQAMLEIKKKFGKNAVLKGSSLQEGATARERNNQIGGHRA